MNETEITFLSSRGRGLSNDLALLKDYLAKQSGEDVKLRYYLNNERHKNPLAAHGYRRAKKDFMEGMTNVVCVDASLSTKINNLAPEGSRILLGVPYDYQFKNMFLMESKGKEFNLNTFARFTHIIPGSPFTADLLKRAYRLEDKEIIEGVSLPFAYDIGDDRTQFKPDLDFDKLSKDLLPNQIFVICPHPVMKNKIVEKSYDNIEVIRDFSTNDMMLVSDLLVTDYSSVIFEYALLRKPIAFYCYDLLNYNRGFYLNYPDDLPGDVYETQQALTAYLKSPEKDTLTEKYDQFIEKYM